MAKYLLEASYTAEGTRGVVKKGGTRRRELVEEMVKKLDGRVEAFYYAFGPADVYVIIDVPDAVSAAAISLAINQSGAAQVRTHVLLTPEEIDKATKRSVGYRAPGE
jgi:uncharacterized protein with GYD domain